MLGERLNWTTRYCTRLAVCVAAFLLLAPGSARAFYWPGWPGAGVTEPPSITPKQIEKELPPPKTPIDPVDPPKQVPEPATLVIAGLGLGALGLQRVWKRRK